MWKGQYHDQEVAAKVLRLHPKDNLKQIKRVRCRWCHRLAMRINDWLYIAEVLQRGRGMEDPPSSERAAAVRRNDRREPARDDIGVDDEW